MSRTPTHSSASAKVYYTASLEVINRLGPIAGTDPASKLYQCLEGHIAVVERLEKEFPHLFGAKVTK